RARRKHREKRGGGAEHVDVDELEIAAPPGNEEESLAVDEALDRLAAHDAGRLKSSSCAILSASHSRKPRKCLASPSRPPSATGLTRVPGCTMRLARITSLFSTE